MSKPVYNPLTGVTKPSPKTRTMKALSAADVDALLLLARQYDTALYRRITGGNFIRAKVLVERRVYR